MRMKDLCPEDRPREKMLLEGARKLSNTELLAIIIGSGTGNKNVMEVARELLAMADNRLMILSSMPVERIQLQKGLGKVRAVSVCAALELGRRLLAERDGPMDCHITSPETVYRLMVPSLGDLDHEECWVLYLNLKKRMLAKDMISSGSLEKTTVDTRTIVRKAIEKQARSIILVHNHPSGDPTPSEGDIRQTDLLRRALRAMELRLLDHIIIARNSFFSFADEQVKKF